MRAAALLLLLSQFAFAQPQSTPRPEDLGTVTGHITCADTQRPARLAQVRLVPVVPAARDLPSVWTDMSGGYTIRNVHPGQYYLRAELMGYLTPLNGFTLKQLSKPTPEDQQRIQQELQLITVASHSTLLADATLRRGATISGTVSYDDGSPAIGLNVEVFTRDKLGKSLTYAPYETLTNPRGVYQVQSVPAGDYIVETSLNITDQSYETLKMADGKSITAEHLSISFSLPVYSGSVFRQKDASTIKVDDGHDTTGVDITIPISQLHEVSGTLVAKDGHTINSGKVALLFADDRSPFTTVEINNDDSTFHFLYVPEGDYIVSVEQAKDVGHTEVPKVPGSDPAMPTEHPTLHTYETLEQPLKIHTDIQSLNLIVPDKSATTTPLNTSTGTN